MRIGGARAGSVLLGAILLAGVACNGESPTVESVDSGEGAEAVSDQEQVVALPHSPPDESGVVPVAAIEGVLRADPDRDGGCVWLEALDGRTVPLVWTDELYVRFQVDGPAQVEDEAGTVHAVEGDAVRLGGGAFPGRAERCDLGEDQYWLAYFDS